MIIYFSLLVCLVGLIMYALSANPKVSTIGLHMFWTGLLAFMITIPGHTLTLPH